MNSNISIVDTTLRDGEQSPGVVFSTGEKVHVAEILDEIGVHQIEAGIPVMGGSEKEAVKAIVDMGLGASIITWNRAVVADIDSSLDCGVDAVAISMPVSDIHIKHKLGRDREWVLESMRNAVSYAKDHGVYVCVSGEDASRANQDFVVEFSNAARDAGADRFRYCDTLGILEPFDTSLRIRRLMELADIDVEVHTHNDFGMATANALAGIRAGASHVSVTVNGLGERAGNAPLEEVVMALKHIEGIDLGVDTACFRKLSEYVANASSRAIPVSKPIVGSSIFAHESGIHADGVIKNPVTYEPFSPGDVGLERKILIGKHSGSHAIRHAFEKLGVNLTKKESRSILGRVRIAAENKKKSLSDDELISIYQEYK
ncbi:MAG: homocitrate synthase [Methanophagales archaeon]|nr:homocitrate synthase [Methanophagales archaeon]